MGQVTELLYQNQNKTDKTILNLDDPNSPEGEELKRLILTINSSRDNEFFKQNKPCSQGFIKEVINTLSKEQINQLKARSQDTKSPNNLAPKTLEPQQTTPESSISKDESPSVLENSPNRSDHPNVLPIDELKPKVKQILQRDEKVLDWDVAKELDQPSWNVHEVLKDIAEVSHIRMIGYVWVPLGN